MFTYADFVNTTEASHQLSEGSPAPTTTDSAVGNNREPPVAAKISGNHTQTDKCELSPPPLNPCLYGGLILDMDGVIEEGGLMDEEELELFRYLRGVRAAKMKEQAWLSDESERLKGPFGIFYSVVRNVRVTGRVVIPSVLTPDLVPEPLCVLNRRTNDVFNLPRLERQGFDSYERLEEFQNKRQIRSNYKFGAAPPKKIRPKRQAMRDQKVVKDDFVRQSLEDGFMLRSDNYVFRMNQDFLARGLKMDEEVQFVFTNTASQQFSCHIVDLNRGFRTEETLEYGNRAAAKKEAARVWLFKGFTIQPFVLQGLDVNYVGLMNERLLDNGKVLSAEFDFEFRKMGQDHIPTFTCRVVELVTGRKSVETGEFCTKKEAKQDAARLWLERGCLFDFERQGLEGGFHTLFMEETPHSRFIEDTLILLLGLLKSDNKSTVMIHVMNYFKLIFRGEKRPSADSAYLYSLVMSGMEHIGAFSDFDSGSSNEETEQQSESSDEEITEADYEEFSRRLNNPSWRMRDADDCEIELQGLEQIFAAFSSDNKEVRPRQKNFLLPKLMKLFAIIAAMGMYLKSNIPFGPELFKVVEGTWFSTFKFTANILTDALEIVKYLCHQGWLVYTTGSFDSLFHSPENYGKWIETVVKLERYENFLSTAEAHGFTVHEFHYGLTTAISEGELMVKKLKAIGDQDLKTVEIYLNKLKSMDMRYRSVEYCQAGRVVPFSILIYGSSSIGKTSIREILLRQFAFTRRLPYKNEYIYNVNPEANFWDNFRSHMWAVSMDDIARYNVKVCQAGGDPTLKAILDVINGTPFIPDQANLNDKGRTPVKSEIAIATTNTKDLNASFFFKYPAAILRRFPFVVTPVVKAAYAGDGGKLDSAKVPASTQDTFPDLWDWTVEEVQLVNQTRGGTQSVIYNKILDSVALGPFMQWYVAAIRTHFTHQLKIDQMRTQFDDMSYCATCSLTRGICSCTVQNFVKQGDDFEYFETPLMAAVTVAIFLFSFFSVFTVVRKASCALIELKEEAKASLKDVSTSLCVASNAVRAFNFRFGKYGTRSDEIIENFDNLAGAAELVAAPVKVTYLSAITLVEMFKLIGERAKVEITKPGFLVKLGLFVGTALVVAKLSSYLFTPAKKKFKHEGNEQSRPSQETFELPKRNARESENVWKKDDFPTSSISISAPSKCSQGGNILPLLEKLKKQTVLCRATPGKISAGCAFRGFCTGEFLITSAHCVPDFEHNLEVSFSYDDGLSAGQTFKVVPYQIYREPKSDFCLIQLSGLRPTPHLQKFFPLETHSQSSPGIYFRREVDGKVTEIRMDRMSRLEMKDPETGEPVSVWSGNATHKTEKGNCGMPLLLETSVGPTIAGTHYGGGIDNATYVVASRLTREMFERGVRHLECNRLELCRRQGLDLVVSVLPKIPNYPDEGQVRLDGLGCDYQLTDLHFKSPVRFVEEQGELEIFGSLSGFRSSHNSDVEHTPMFDFFLKHNFYSMKVPPDLKTWKPKRLCLLDSTAARNCINQEQLDICVFTFANEVLAGLDKNELENIGPLSLQVAINGAPGVSYIDAINKSTSCGFPWKKGKTHLLVMRDPTDWEESVGYTVMWDPKQELKDRIDDLVNNYKLGFRNNPVFCAQLKDEAVSEQKAEIGKTRVFVSAPVHFTILVRKILLPFVRLVQNNKFLFESGPGTAAQSSEWGDIYKYLTQFGKDRIIAGDYSAFDKKMAAQVVRAAMHFILIICSASGAFSEEDLAILVGICSDVNFPICDFFGDLIRFLSTNPSGWPLTVILNGIVNCTYMRLAYYNLNPKKEVRTFKLNVALITYGDDNTAGVSVKVPWFNHTAISEYLLTIGVKYTMAEKEKESVPYISISDSTFLKRKWRWEPDVDGYVCPLEIDSVKKQVTVWVKSKILTQKAHCVSTLFSAHWELFFHGREFFDHWDSIFKEAVEVHALQEWMPKTGFPSWTDYVEKWKRASEMFVSSLDKVFWSNLEAGLLAGAYSQRFHDESVAILKAAGINVVLSPAIEELVKYTLAQNFGWKVAGAVVGGGEYVLYVVSYLRARSVGTQLFGADMPTFMIMRLIPLVGHIVTAKMHEDGHSAWAVMGHMGWNFVCFLPAIFAGITGLTDQDFVYRGLKLAHESGQTIHPDAYTDWDCGCPWAASWHKLICQEPKLANSFSYLAPRIMNIAKLWSERKGVVDGEQSSRGLLRPGKVLPKRQYSNCNDRFILQGLNEPAETLINFDSSENTVIVSKPGIFQTPTDTGISLSDWFKRPILIKTIKWGETERPFEEFFPWDLYFNNKVVLQKMRGYSRMRASLHIKVVVNCSPFRFAKAMVSYRPLGDPVGSRKRMQDELDLTSIQNYQDNPFCFSGGQIYKKFNGPDGHADEGFMARSQRPNFLVDMAKSEGGEMILPFLYYSDWFDCTQSQVTRPTDFVNSPWFNDLRRMGMVTFEGMQTLRSVSSASADKSTISVYAWCESIELAGASLQLQGDDYENRPVSSVASAVAAATGALSSVPVIGPYMRATSMFASGLGTIARWFGFSNPPVIDSVHGYRTMYMPNVASTEISTQIEKLSMDPKQEVNIDPRTVGAPPVDELTVASFAQRETYIFQTQWYTSDDQNGNLAGFYVVPEYYYGTNITTGYSDSISAVAWQTTPLAHVCQWFKFWRGSMVYKFRIVKTSFHRGRLRITYDPAGAYTTYTEGLLHTKIVDISDTDEFDFEIPFMATTPWLKTTQVPYVATATKFWGVRGNPGPIYDPKCMNGFVRLEVLNELGSMDDAEPVSIMVYASGGKDFQLASPVCFNAGTTTDLSYTAPYNLEAPPVELQGDNTVGGGLVDDKVVSSTMGESVVSIRQLLHRTSVYGVLVAKGGSANYNFYKTIVPRLLRFAGAGEFPDVSSDYTTIGNDDVHNFHTTSGGRGYNYLAMHPIPYFAGCFVGQRGSIVYRIQTSVVANNPSSVQFVGRLDESWGSVDNATTSVTAYTVGSTSSKQFVEIIDSSAAGLIVNKIDQSSTDCVAPHYSQYLMLPANPSLIPSSYKNKPEMRFGLDTDGLEIVTDGIQSMANPLNVQSRLFCSAGVDYQMFMFLNVPTLFSVSTPTSANT